jgi:ribosome-associated protein
VTATDRSKQLTVAAAEAASAKLADRIVAFDVSEQLVITDVFMVCSASNDRQVRAIVDAVEEKLHGMGTKPTRREGHREGRWVLLDYVDIVVHVQHEDERTYYALDRIWADCPVIDLPESVAAGRSEHGGASA